MNSCEHLSKVHAYHDGELATQARAAVEAHIKSCAACSAELLWLRKVSASAAALAMPGNAATDAMIERVDEAVEREPSRGAVRLAWGLTAAAAAIVVVCLASMYISRGSQPQADPPAPWELLANAGGVDLSGSSSEELQLARWLANDLSSASRERGERVWTP